MRTAQSLLLVLVFFSCKGETVNTYSASTPADPVVRTFLGISLKDSIDFIRWHLVLNDAHYTLTCEYGIGKPNTNGFIDKKEIRLSGAVTKKENQYLLQNGNKILKMASINTNLLHVLDDNGDLMKGNEGWSYTLNNIKASPDARIYFKSAQLMFKDSIVLVGRTPCGIPGIIPAGTLCYKLKWKIVLYTGDLTNTAGSYKVYGTTWRKQGGKTGKWEAATGAEGRIIYRLYDDNGSGLLHLAQLDNNILVFTDADNKLLVGDEDFSYTLNRTF